MLSRSVEQRLRAAQELQQAGDYTPNDRVLHKLGASSLVMFVGPTNVGKSSIMNAVVRAESDSYSIARSFTTRPATDHNVASSDEFITHTDEDISIILDKIDAGDLVHYGVDRTTGYLYGSELSLDDALTTLIDLPASDVETMTRLPFKETQTLGVIAPSYHWALWFNERYPAYDNERGRRVQEAGTTLRWIDRHQPNLPLIENKNHNLASPVQEVLATLQGERIIDPRITRELAKTLRNCLTAAESLGYRENA